jgi:hypothetical protein
MGCWYQIRKLFFLQAFRALPTQPHRLVSWAEVRQVGILLPHCEPTSTSEWRDAVNFLHKQNIAVHTLAWVREKQQQSDIPSFSNKEVRWNFVPDSKEIKAFTEQNFHVLFAFYPHENLTLDYIVQKSKAICRIGFFHEKKTSLFDFMIKSGNSPLPLIKLIEQSIQYLQKIEK